MCWVRQSDRPLSVRVCVKIPRWKPAYYKSFQKWRYTTHKVISSSFWENWPIFHIIWFTWIIQASKVDGKNCDGRNRVLVVTVSEVQNVFALLLQSNIYLLDKHYKSQEPSECCQYWHNLQCLQFTGDLAFIIQFSSNWSMSVHNNL